MLTESARRLFSDNQLTISRLSRGYDLLPRPMLVVFGARIPLPILEKQINSVLTQFPDAARRRGSRNMAKGVVHVLHDLIAASIKEAEATTRKTPTKQQLNVLAKRVCFDLVTDEKECGFSSCSGLSSSARLKRLDGEWKASTSEERLVGYLIPQDLPWINSVSNNARSGSKLLVKPASEFRVPTTEFVKDAAMGLGRGLFNGTEGGDAVFTEIGNTQIRIDCDDETGLNALRVIELFASYGPAIMQTFLAMMGMWAAHNPGANHETYLTIRVTDLMRYMNRKELSGGGYHTADQIQKGREIFLLSRATIPSATRKSVYNKKGCIETISLDRLLHVQNMKVQQSVNEGQVISRILEFRYHPNKAIYDVLCGDAPQYAKVSGKLLSYHSLTHKYHIQLGYGLVFYDRANRHQGQRNREISLMALLKLSSIPIPPRNLDRFFKRIQKAIHELGCDGVVPGAHVDYPQELSHSAREQLEKAKVVYPPLLTSIKLALPPPVTTMAAQVKRA